ncbi:MAG: SagB/ThcOx family dehydrogenase [Holophaga sp.]|nr:SagB/ThcOx family dehydrogenase [Holophaga sp.]
MHLARPAIALFVTCILGAQEPLPVKLPAPVTGGATLAEALAGRKTVRTLAGPGLTLNEAGQLLWAAQGENRPGARTVPSAHAKYPLELYLLTSGSATLQSGLYHYLPAGNQLQRLGDGSPNATLGKLKSMQPWIAAAPAVFVLGGVPTRIDPTGKNTSLTFYEAGAAAQDLLLQAVALGLEAGTAAGIDMTAVAQALKLPAGTQSLIVLPVGREKK